MFRLAAQIFHVWSCLTWSWVYLHWYSRNEATMSCSDTAGNKGRLIVPSHLNLWKWHERSTVNILIECSGLCSFCQLRVPLHASETLHWRWCRGHGGCKYLGSQARRQQAVSQPARMMGYIQMCASGGNGRSTTFSRLAVIAWDFHANAKLLDNSTPIHR